MSSLTGVTIGSLLNIIHGYLPYRVWLPYDSNIAAMFWITSVQQIVSLIFATIIRSDWNLSKSYSQINNQ